MFSLHNFGLFKLILKLMNWSTVANIHKISKQTQINNLSWILFPEDMIEFYLEPDFGQYHIIVGLRKKNTIESSAIALISAGRWIDSVKPRLWRSLTHSNLYLTLMLSIPWISTIPTIIPALIKSSEIDTGWNCSIGGCTEMIKCTVIDGCPSKSLQMDFILVFNCVITATSIIVTIVSYVMIKRKVRRSSVRIVTLTQYNELQLQKKRT